MLIQQMPEEECRAVLARVSFGRLACARDNQPYVVPIYFAYDGSHVYGFSTPGQKIDWMRGNPLVCLEADERESREQWTSVIISGRYQELADTADLAAARAQAHRALQQHAKWWDYTAVAAAEWRRKDKPFEPIFYRIHIDKISGHRATPGTAA